MQANQKTHIFISGAGPVGLTAGMELLRRGFVPRLVEPDLDISPQSRALAINPRTLDLLESSGATEAMLAAGNRVHSALVRYNSNHLFTMNLRAAKHRFNFLLCLPQSETEKILAAVFEQHGGRVERGVALADFSVHGPALSLSLSDGTKTSADILVGADGAHSLVRKKLGLGFPGESMEQVFGLADVELDDWPFATDQAVATIREDHIIAYLPMREGFGRFISTRPDTLNVLPAEAKPRRIVWQAEFRISYRQVETYQHGNVFLAGDAAHIHSPVGGRGMNLGIEDACWLAWLIDQKRTSEYSALRHPVGAHVLKLTNQPTNLISSNSFTAKILRRWILPQILGMDWVQHKILPGLLALDTPSPPWL